MKRRYLLAAIGAAALALACCSAGHPASQGHTGRPGPVGIAGAVQTTRTAGTVLAEFDFDEIYASTTHSLRFTGSFDLAHLIGQVETEEVVPVAGASPAPGSGGGASSSSTTTGPASPSTSTASSPSTALGQPPRALLYHGTTVLTATDYYVSLPSGILSQTGGRQWADIPLSTLGQLVQDAGLNTLQAALLDPSLWWDILGSTGSHARFLETAVVDGTSTRVYHAEADLLTAAGTAGPLLPVLDQTVSALGTPALPVQVAIDGQGHIRQASLSMAFPLSVPGSAGTPATGSGGTTTTSPPGLSSFQLDATVTFVTFGVPVTVSIPKPDKTLSFASVMPTLMGRSSSSSSQPPSP